MWCGRVRCVEYADRFVVTGHAAAADGAFELTISKADGTLGPYVVGGRTLFEGGGGALHLYRAPTENDAGDTQTTVTHPTGTQRYGAAVSRPALHFTIRSPAGRSGS